MGRVRKVKLTVKILKDAFPQSSCCTVKHFNTVNNDFFMFFGYFLVGNKSIKHGFITGITESYGKKFCTDVFAVSVCVLV